MKKTVLKQSLLTGIAVFALAITAPVATFAQPARAQEAQAQAEERREMAQQTAQTQQEAVSESPQNGEEMRTQSEERREQGQARLEAAKLNACLKREKAVTNIMARISDRGTKQLDVFAKISDRVQSFYTDQGNTLSNYDTLVANVNAKKEAAQAAVETVKNNNGKFKCDGENPKAVADSFKSDQKAMNAALKEYKTAIKDLIVGVKSVQSTAATEGSTERNQE